MTISDPDDGRIWCQECGQICAATVVLGRREYEFRVCLACLGRASTLLAHRATARAKEEAQCESR